MHYVRRLIESKLTDYAKSFACTLLTGARQVGKSTLLQHLFGSTHKTFVFDPVQDLYGVKSDPDLFLRNNPPPLILDEIQYVPELVPAIKRYVDKDRRPGMYLITGSQQWHVMRELSESLAGRVGMLELQGFSCQEILEKRCPCWLNVWLEESCDGVDSGMEALRGYSSANLSAMQRIWRGAFPEVQELNETVIPGWMQGYVSTYLQRDVRRLMEVRDEMQFAAFLGLCAALTAQETNYTQLGRDVGLSSPTAKQWIATLRSTYQWLEVPAFSTNTVKRLSGRPKGYLTDTGLACHLMRLSSPEAVQGHPAFGALFETLAVLECHRQLQEQPLVPTLYQYRQHSGAEVDLVIEKDGHLHPVEIKAASHARPADARSLAIFRQNVPASVKPGLVIYAGSEILKLDDYTIAVPFDLA